MERGLGQLGRFTCFEAGPAGLGALDVDVVLAGIGAGTEDLDLGAGADGLRAEPWRGVVKVGSGT